jgi:hypothetical protein
LHGLFQDIIYVMKKSNLISKLLDSNLHFVWLVIFFGLHGLNEFETSLSMWDVGVFSFVLFCFGFVLYLLFTRIYRNYSKAGLVVTMLLSLFVFFGAIQDTLSSYKLTALLSTLPYLLTITFIFLLVFFLWIKFRREVPLLLTKYINLLLTLLIVVEIVVILNSNLFSEKEVASKLAGFKICDTCAKPPVYLVILDEYAGRHTLENYCQFDNSFFYESLSKRGFHITDSSTSNYGLTVFSMASMLNMNFIGNAKELIKNKHYAYRNAIKSIKENSVTDFFSKHGYEIRNYSFFDLKQAPAMVKNDLWGGNLRLLTGQTLYARVGKSLPFYLARMKISQYFIEEIENQFIHQLDRSLSETVIREKQNGTTPSKPGFTYIHLNLPHPPFLMDSLGQRVSRQQRQHFSAAERQAAYLQYLVYCNKRILEWVDSIQSVSGGEAVILLMSDHGTTPLNHKDQKLRRMDNLNAVYIPGLDYSKWYKGFSNVNQFTVLLNELFNQELQMKPDIAP